MPDGSLRDTSSVHWYFLPVLLMAGLLVQRRKPADEMVVPDEKKNSTLRVESALFCFGKKALHALCWLFAVLPLLWIADFGTFLLRARGEVLLPKWERTANPWTWPDPKDLGLDLQHASVYLIFFGVLIGTCVFLPLLLGVFMRGKNPPRIQIAYFAMISVVAMVVVIKYAWSYVIWILD
jgi:hypothetical protein